VRPPGVLVLQVFQRAGLSSPILGSIFMGLINVGVTLLAASLMDRWEQGAGIGRTDGGKGFGGLDGWMGVECPGRTGAEMGLEGG
jgi:hypothetical protein